MPETGQTWQRRFAAQAEQAGEVRTWVGARLSHEDAQVLANELFIAVMAARPGSVQMTVSTADTRARIIATGDDPLPITSVHGPGRSILRALATVHGTTPDECGLWAEVTQEQTT